MMVNLEWLHARLHALHIAGLKITRKGEHVTHIAYLGMVGIEAHGNYRWAALAAVTFILLNAVLEKGE